MAPAKTEATPLKEGGDAESSEFATSKLAAPLAIVFYIAVAVVKTMTTKALLVTSKTAIAISAFSSIVTCLCLIPIFLVKPSTWGVPDVRKNGPGLALVVFLLSFDMGLTNFAVQELTVPIQQCLLAVNPTVTVIIESIVRRRLKHPVIYFTVLMLCFGPVLNMMGGSSDAHKSTNNSALGYASQLVGVLASACKYIFAHSVMRDCKKELGSAFAFLFWLDILSLIILVPWSFIAGDMQRLVENTVGVLAWAQVVGNSALGGLRFFSQLIVLRYSTPTNLSCANIAFQAINIYLSLALFNDQKITPWLIAGTMVTIATSAVYTYWKTSGILEKNPGCIKFNTVFAETVTCAGRTPKPDPTAQSIA